MKIVIVGAGFTGIQLAKLLVNEKNQVTVIENDENVARHVANQLDGNVVVADGNNLEVLEDAGIAKADALVCVTSSDEVNMITCSLVDAVYPDVLKIARVRNYAYYVNTASAEKKHAEEGAIKHRPLYGINYMIHPDVEAAQAVVETVANGAIGNVITFDDSDLEIARVRIEEGSPFDGVALKSLRSVTDVHFLVTYVEQDGETSLPSGNTVFTAGCTVGVLVSKKDLPAVTELCGSKQKELRKVALIGAGRIGNIIAEKIIQPQKSKVLSKIFTPSKRGTDFVIIDSDEVNAKAAAQKFPDARVFCADATDENFLNEEGITDFDLAICVTHNHELNMVLAAYLESLGVKQTISLVTSSAFAGIATKLGVDVPIPLRDSVVDSIMSHLRGKSVQEIHTINEGELELVECVVSEKARFNGKTLMEISSPGEFLVLLAKKANTEEFVIAGGSTKIETGDRIVLMTKSEISKKVLENFA